MQAVTSTEEKTEVVRRNGGAEEINKKVKETQRLQESIPWAVTCVAIVIVTLGVHYKALCEDRTDLLLPHLISSMEAKCRLLGDAFEHPVTVPLLHPVPTQFGVAVWVEDELWSLSVHDALDRIERAIAPVVYSRSGANGARLIQRLVRVARNASGKKRKGNSDLLTATATAQQLGLGVAKHVYAADLLGELLMHGISFFRSSVSHSGDSHIKCFTFAERQAYCTIPDGVATEWLSREVPAAIATLMSRWLSLESFRDVNAVRRWALQREARSCHYALRALQQLKRSVDAHPDMPAPEGVGETIRRLHFLIESEMFAHFARAADDLQFHPLLLPQVYIPWDQALVNHASILLPVFTMGLIGIRTAVAEYRRRRGPAELQMTVDAKKEE